MAIKTTAIIVAAGNSTRMGKGCKQLILLQGKPVLFYTLSAFEQARLIDESILVCRKQEEEAFLRLIDEYRFTKVKALAPGGATRQASVASGISVASKETEYFAIHDGARCLITPQIIDAVVRDAFLYKASSVGMPVKDTIKVVSADGFVESTPNRKNLWAVQTPQVFERTSYLSALHRAEEEGKDYTDDCQLIEQNGGRVHMCMGSYQNIKITTADDITLAKSILQERGDFSEDWTRIRRT